MNKIILFYNDLNIASKLRFIGLFSAFITGSIVLISLITFEYSNEKESTVKESKVFAQIMSVNLVSSLVRDDRLELSNILSSVEYNDKIRQTYVLDTEWKVVGVFHKGNNYKRQTDIVKTIQTNTNLWKDGFYYAVIQITDDEKKLGYAVVVSSLSYFYDNVYRNVFFVFIILIIALFIASRLEKIFNRSILEPIESLDISTTEIIKTKNLNTVIPVLYDDEIGDLTKNFNHMIHELEKQKKTLYQQANYDSLTNIPNRALFYDRLEQSISLANVNNEKFALLFIDLDNFKELNDTFGHEYGDILLQEVAKRFESLIQEYDTVARLGGDEFTLILNNIKEYHFASVVAQKILDIFQTPVDIKDEEIFIGCSIGISLYPEGSQEASGLVRNADIAMYESKERGKNTYSYYLEDMSEKLNKRMRMQTEIRQALDNKEFIVYYQAQYDSRTNKVVGYEALVRWNKDGEILLPVKFIAMSEELGMLVSINRQVMKTTMLQAKLWIDQGFTFRRISINVAVEQLEDSNFMNFFTTLLSETECSGEWIGLEITENQLMHNAQETMKVLKAIRELGVKVSIDDFGTGYSSLAYLKDLDVDSLKIDQLFIKDIVSSRDNRVIVDAIISIAKSLDMEVVCEGVEKEEEKNYLLEKGCFIIQGFLYAYPQPASEIN